MLYNLIDKTTKQTILESATISEIAQFFGVKKLNISVSNYSKTGYVYGGRYVFESGTEIKDEMSGYYREFKEQWDNARLRINPKAKDTILGV